MDVNNLKEYYSAIKLKISQGNFKIALEYTDQLLKIFPNDYYCYYFKGVCFFALKSYENSIKFYTVALKLNSVFAKAYFNLGVSCFMLDKKDLALINIGKALILFSKVQDKAKKQRCINAIRFISGEELSVE